MSLLPSEIEMDKRYDKFLAWGAWWNAVVYAVPAAIILAVCWYTEVASEFWVSILIIYFIGAVAHLLDYGLMAVNIQNKTSTDQLINEMKLLVIALNEK